MEINKKGIVSGRWMIMIFCWMVISCNEKPPEETKPVATLKDSIRANKAGRKRDIFHGRPMIVDTMMPIIFEPVEYNSSKQYIYLTFDDGPQHGTEAVFDLCDRLGVKSTFFMVGLHADRKSDGHQLVNMIRDNYPTTLLANHSFTHANDKYKYFYHHPVMAEEDFYQAQQSLHVPFKIIRLPGNSSWITNNSFKSTKLVNDVCIKLDSAGYNVIGWDLEWHFNSKTANPVQSAEKMAIMVDTILAKNQTHTINHIVILSHDRMFRNPNYTDSLEKFITLLKRNPNYVFETVDHYPNLKPLK
jgi:peptidoglycan/xylan/chitin deacetylase (PgdA/CDA1 family)